MKISLNEGEFQRFFEGAEAPQDLADGISAVVVKIGEEVKGVWLMREEGEVPEDFAGLREGMRNNLTQNRISIPVAANARPNWKGFCMLLASYFYYEGMNLRLPFPENADYQQNAILFGFSRYVELDGERFLYLDPNSISVYCNEHKSVRFIT